MARLLLPEVKAFYGEEAEVAVPGDLLSKQRCASRLLFTWSC